MTNNIEMATLSVNVVANIATAANFASLSKPEWTTGVSAQHIGTLPLGNVLSLIALGAAFYNLVVTVKAYQQLKKEFHNKLETHVEETFIDDNPIKNIQKQLTQLKYNCLLLLYEFVTLLAANIIKLSPALAPAIGFVVPYIFVAYLAPRLAFSLFQIGKELILASKAKTDEERSAHYQAAVNHAVTAGLQTLGMLLVVLMMINPISGVGFIPMSFAISLLLLTGWAVMKAVEVENTNATKPSNKETNQNTMSLAQWVKGKMSILSKGKAYKDATLLGNSPASQQAS